MRCNAKCAKSKTPKLGGLQKLTPVPGEALSQLLSLRTARSPERCSRKALKKMDDDCCIHGVDFTESCDLCYAEELMPADIRDAYWRRGTSGAQND